MLKKIISFLMFGVCVFFLSGCNDVQNLTEEETQLIAEYAADLLLKYDLNYEDRINEGEKDAKEIEADSSSETEITEEITTEENTADQNEDDKVENGKEDHNSEKTDTVGSEKDIAKIAGLEGVTIGYKDYQFSEQYPADDENQIMNLEASEGNQLFIIRFKIENITKDAVNVSLIDKNLEYRVVCNGTKAATPMLTILTNDLGTLDTVVNKGEEQEAVLIFQISNDMEEKLESIELHINYDNVDNVIGIL